MNKLVRHLSIGASSFAMAAAVAFVSQPAMAQPTPENVEAVTVTGTSIRGVAPVGSHVATIDESTIQTLAPVSVTDVLSSLPQLSNAGTAPQGENTYSFYSPNIHNLAASASSSTLVVVDGMRIPGGGSQWAEADPNIIPVVALQRVEVLADGASSVYGSDAVSGVVNFITKKSFDGLQIDAQTGVGDEYNTYNADFLWGTHWENGNVFVAASYAFGSNITLADRPFTSMGDYTSVGGNNQRSTACPTASIHPTARDVGAVAGPNYWYAGPGDATGYANTQAARPCNNSIYGDLLPQIQRTNTMVKASQDFFGGKLNVTDTFVYNDLHTRSHSGPGTLSATAFGPTSGKGGQINPFFQAPAGDPGTNTEQISWVDLLNPLPLNTSTEDVIYNRVNATYNISDNWHFDVDWVLGQNSYNTATVNGFCSSCAYLAMNGTAQSGGSTTATDIAGRNVISLQLPLTTANALDVWDAPGSNKTSAATIRSLVQNSNYNPIINDTNQLRGAINGALFDLPGGAVHVALGGELYVQHILKIATGSNNTGTTATGSNLQPYHYHRVVQSGFAEIQVPLVSPEMNIPFVHKLSVDVSGRIDSFSDVGDTSNPKFAAEWAPTDDLTFRANYSTAFVAPPLLSIGDPTLGYMYAGGASVGGQLDNIPIANFPGIQNIPAATCTTTGKLLSLSPGCQYVTLGNTDGTGGIGGTGGDKGLERQMGGGFVNVKPETGYAWSVGFDYNPDWLQGFHSSVTLWHNTFKGAVNAAHIQQTANVPSLFHFFQVCNGGTSPCTQAQIDAFTNVANGATTGAFPAGPIWYLWAHDETNFLYLQIQGVDFDVSYDFDMGDLGTLHVGDYFTLFTKFDEGYDGKDYFSIKGTSGFNGTFASLEYNTRLNVGWTGGPWGVDAFVNYFPGYHNWNSTSVTPLAPNALGVPTAGDKVSPLTTLDLNVSYTFADGFLGGDQFYVHANNVFDTNPPFINTTANGAGASAGAAFGFNAFNANPIGRTVTFGLRAKL